MEDEQVRDSAGGRSSSSSFIASLTGIRAVMGFWVIADHVFPPMVKLFPALEPLRFALSGGIALDTFFILSGFVISHAYVQRLTALDRRRYTAFLWARVTRLYPVHLFALLAMAGLLPVLHAMYGSDFVTASNLSAWTFSGNLFMLQAVPGVEAWNPPSWAVSTEMAAYVVFPFLAATLGRLSRWRALGAAVVLVCCLGLVLAALKSAALTPWAIWWVRPLGEFGLGCLLWAAWRHGVVRHRLWDLVAATAFVGVLAVLGSGRFGVPQFAAVPLLGVLVVAAAGSDGVVHHLLTGRAVQWAGRTSYSRYLMHVPVLTVLGLFLPVSVFAAYAPLWFRAALVVLWFVATFAVGAVVYRVIERPVQRWLRRRVVVTIPEGTDTATGSETSDVPESQPTRPEGAEAHR